MVAPYKVIAIELILVMGALVIGGIVLRIVPLNSAYDVTYGVVLAVLAILGVVVLVCPVPGGAEVTT
jgi:hypothetical protein